MPYKEFIEVYNKKTGKIEIKRKCRSVENNTYGDPTSHSETRAQNTPKFDDNLFNDDNEAKKNLKELANVICRPINRQ